MEVLKARGEITDNLMKNIFKAYHISPDEKLFRYIKTKKYIYDNYKDITSKQLIMASFKKYEIINTLENET